MDGFTVPERAGGRRPLGEISVRLPPRGEDAVAIRSGGLTISVRESGARGDGAIVGSAVMYPREGGASLWAATPEGLEGFEEWLHLEPSSARGERIAATWTIEGASVRKAGEGAEIVDAAGIARIRVTAPIAYVKSGRAVPVRLDIAGAQIAVVVDAEGEEVLVDPLWTSTASMASARAFHTATLLPSGKVLVAGCSSLLPAEVYDPGTSTWSLTGPMTAPRCYHTATLLPSGKVLVVGGQGNWAALASTEVYDPQSNTWAPDAPLSGPRTRHTATTLLSSKVLIYGGNDESGNYYQQVQSELYDPATTTWSTLAGSTSVQVTGHTATLLPSGNVLLAGGVDTFSSRIYDPVADTWKATAKGFPGFNHAATLLANGKVLLTGGMTAGLSAEATLYDPINDAWSAATSMAFAREDHTATLLPSGKVFVADGWGYNSAELAGLYDPVNDTWSPAGSMSTPRDRATATLLANGDVLVAGGFVGVNVTATAELYHSGSASAPGDPCAAANDCGSGFCADGVCCTTACSAGACDACSIAAGATVDGTCQLFTGALCDDGDPCTQADTCQSGVCSGGIPVSCAAADECHDTGSCTPGSGQCSNPPRADGSLCSGGACTSGVCVPSTSSSGSGGGGATSSGVGGGASASSSAGVGGSASASSSAGVGSSASASASVGVGGSASASSSAGVGGGTSASTSAGVGGSASVSSSAGVGSSASASASAGVGGSASASSSAGVGSSASASASVGVGGSASASSSAGVGGSGASGSVAATGGGPLYRAGSCRQEGGGSAGAHPAWLALGLVLLRRRRARVQVSRRR